MVGMHIASEHHGIGHLGRGQVVQQARAGGRVAVPAIGPVAAAAVAGVALAVAGHQGLLGQQVPGAAGVPGLRQPALLRCAQQAAVRLDEGRAFAQVHGVRSAAARLGADLGVAPAAAVQRDHTGQRSPVPALVEPQRRQVVGPRLPGLGEGHVLPIGLNGSGPARREVSRQVVALVACIVVRHLVVVPGAEPGCAGVHGLQVRVALVQGVALAVVVQGLAGAAGVLALGLAVLARAVLIDVVAQEEHQVQLLLGHVAPGGVEAVVIALAGGDGEAQGGRCVGCRRGARAPDDAALAQGTEAIPVPAIGLQAAGLGMHGMGAVRARGFHAAGGNALEALVLGKLPANLDLFGQRRAGEPGPQHQSIRTRAARSQAQGESLGVGGQGMAQEQRRRACRQGPLEKLATVGVDAHGRRAYSGIVMCH